MTETTLIVSDPVGLHARSAAEIYRKAREFKSQVTIQNLSRPGSLEVAVSAYNILQMGAVCGHQVRLRAEGEDEREVIAALAALVDPSAN